MLTTDELHVVVVVPTGMVVFTTVVDLAGQLVTDEAQLVMVTSEVEYNVMVDTTGVAVVVTGEALEEVVLAVIGVVQVLL